MSKKFDDELLVLIAGISDEKLLSNVFDNLFTPQEREELGLRVQIFKALLAGESQREIAMRLGVSLGTISRGSRELQYGKNGVKKVLSGD